MPLVSVHFFLIFLNPICAPSKYSSLIATGRLVADFRPFRLLFLLTMPLRPTQGPADLLLVAFEELYSYPFRFFMPTQEMIFLTSTSTPCRPPHTPRRLVTTLL